MNSMWSRSFLPDSVSRLFKKSQLSVHLQPTHCIHWLALLSPSFAFFLFANLYGLSFFCSSLLWSLTMSPMSFHCSLFRHCVFFLVKCSTNVHVFLPVVSLIYFPSQSHSILLPLAIYFSPTLLCYALTFGASPPQLHAAVSWLCFLLPPNLCVALPNRTLCVASVPCLLLVASPICFYKTSFCSFFNLLIQL